MLRRVARQTGLGRRVVAEALRRLVDEGALEHIQRFGTAGVFPSFRRPVAVTSRLVLVPAGQAFEATGLHRAVFLSPGAAFGDGRHPSTRLALEGLERCCATLGASRLGEMWALDVGTGNGVLSIALGRLGLGRVVALDNAPGALAEARVNVACNHLETVVSVSDQSLEATKGHFHLVVANLRPPTLLALAQDLHRQITPGGMAVLTGFRSSETGDVAAPYTAAGLELVATAERGGWAAAILVQRP
jgi:ribosomal protein L11 methyltransferase